MVILLPTEKIDQLNDTHFSYIARAWMHFISSVWPLLSSSADAKWIFMLFLIAFPISGVFNTISSLEESQHVPNNYTASGMTSNCTVTWKKIVVTHCLAIDCPDAGTGSLGSLESTSRRTSPALRSTTAWSQSSSSGPSMRFRWPHIPGQAWASSVSLSLSTHCREVRPCFSVTHCFFCYLTVAASIGLCVFIYSFSSVEGGSVLVWTGWCSTCLHATLRSTLSVHVDATFILELSSQTANFHANPLQNNYVNYVQGHFSLQMRRMHLGKLRVFSFGHFGWLSGERKTYRLCFEASSV